MGDKLQNRNGRRQDASAADAIVEFVPNTQGMLVQERQPPALPPAAHARSMTIARVVLHTLDSNADGRISGEEAAAFAHPSLANIVGRSRAELLLHNASTYPWLARQSTVLDDREIFGRDALISHLRSIDPTLASLRRQDIDQAIREALPGGVEGVTLAQECARHPELPCLPVGARVMVHLDGPSI